MYIDLNKHKLKTVSFSTMFKYFIYIFFLNVYN